MFECIQSEITINQRILPLSKCDESFDIAIKLNEACLNSVTGFNKAELIKVESKAS